MGAKQLKELNEEQEQQGEKIVGIELSETPLENQSEETEHDPLKVVAKDEEGLDEHDFHRVNITGEDSVTCSEKDYKSASGLILDALRFREKYMSMAGQSFCPTTSKYLARVEGAEDPKPAPRVTAECPYGDNVNPTPYAGNWKGKLNFKSKNWQLSKEGMAPNLGLLFAMKNGVLEMYDSQTDKDECRPSQNYFYPDTDEFVEDQAIVMAMMASGQCKTFCYQRLQFLDAKWRLHDLLNGSKVRFLLHKSNQQLF